MFNNDSLTNAYGSISDRDQCRVQITP